MFLSAADLITLTGRKQPAAQIRMLRTLGIRHYVRDGRPVVTQAAVEGGKATPAKARINWEAIGGGT